MIRKSLSLTSLAIAAALVAACGAEAPKTNDAAATKPAEQTAAKATENPAAKPADAPTAKPADAPVTASATATVVVAKAGVAPGEALPSFTAKTFEVVDGKTVEADYDHAKATGIRVYVVNSTTCPYVKKYVDRMVEIETTYAAKGVTFVYAYPNRAETAEAKEAWHTSKGHKAKWIVDQGGPVTKHLKGGKTPEYVIVNADGIVTYRGGIDDSMGSWKSAKAQYLTDALDSTLSGKPVATPVTEAAG